MIKFRAHFLPVHFFFLSFVYIKELGREGMEKMCTRCIEEFACSAVCGEIQQLAILLLLMLLSILKLCTRLKKDD